MVKYQPFYYKLVDHEIKKITSLYLIRLHLQKKIILEMFIAAPPSILLLSLKRNECCFSYCNEFYSMC